MKKQDKNCVFCNFDYSDRSRKQIIAENEWHTSVVNIAPKSKAHSLIVSKEHYKNVLQITSKEWNTMLPLIKDTIKAIKQVYNPIGFALYSVAGDESKPHFHLHIIPKYKKNYGPCRSKKRGELLPDRKAAYQEAAKKLEAKDGILGENNKAISKLASQEDALSKSHIIIKPKKSIPNDIQKVDQETWNQMGELLIDNLKNMKKRFNFGKELIALRIWIPLGEMTGPWQTTISEFQIEIVTRFSDVWDLVPKTENEGRRTRKKAKVKEDSRTLEHERFAEKLRDPEGYYEKWKGDRDYLKHKTEKHANDTDKDLKRDLSLSEREREREEFESNPALIC